MLRQPTPRVSSPVEEAPYPQFRPTRWFAAVAGEQIVAQDEDDEEFRQVALPSRRLEEQQLGPPAPRADCWGCLHMGEYRHDSTMDKSDWAKLMNFLRKAKVHCDPVNVAITLHRAFEKIRQKLLAQGVVLEEWTVASILNHIRNHNTDPECQLWLRASETQEIGQVALKGMVMRNARGEEYVNEKQFTIYERSTKLWMQLMNKVPDRMLFFSHGAHVDSKQAGDGPITASGKRLTNHFEM